MLSSSFFFLLFTHILQVKFRFFHLMKMQTLMQEHFQFIYYLGIFVSFLTLVLSKNKHEKLGHYEWLKVIVLFVLVFTYGIIIKSIGFFLSTNLFLMVAYYYLGVRNPKVIIFELYPSCCRLAISTS